MARSEGGLGESGARRVWGWRVVSDSGELLGCVVAYVTTEDAVDLLVYKRRLLGAGVTRRIPGAELSVDGDGVLVHHPALGKGIPLHPIVPVGVAVVGRRTGKGDVA